MNPAHGGPSASFSRAANRQRLLLVEDDELVRRLLRDQLRVAGFEVLAASSGEEAVVQVRKSGIVVHLVVTDGIMSGIDGFEVARHFARCDPPVRAILITGFIDYFVSRSDVPENIAAMFAKPIKTAELVAKIRELLVDSGQKSGRAHCGSPEKLGGTRIRPISAEIGPCGVSDAQPPRG